MTILDRSIFRRFVTNFVILFGLLFLFAAMIDLVLALDEFVEAARETTGTGASTVAVLLTFVRFAFDFQAPRLFQFYAFLHGALAVGAMAFTLTRMYRHRELTAMLSAGLSMHRIAMPFVVGMFLLSVLQLINQEVFLPRVAPLVIRTHSEIGQRGIEGFAVPFTRDADGTLFQTPDFDPNTESMTRPTILVRDARGRTVRRITGDRAIWRAAGSDGAVASGWELENGLDLRLESGLAGGPTADANTGAGEGREAWQPTGLRRAAIDFYPTNLSPRMLVVRRNSEYASMLSLTQITEMLQTPKALDSEDLTKRLSLYRYGRFSSVIVNVLLMWLALPSFLLRSPANLMTQSMRCAAVTLTAMIVASIFMLVVLPGLKPAVSVFVPTVFIGFLVLWQWTRVRT